MEKSELQTKIAGIVVERLFLSVSPDKIAPEHSLTLKYGIDSVRLFDLVVSMEDDFGVSFEDDELTLENFDTLQKITDRVSAKMA